MKEIPSTSITIFWLIGFIEGEGTFGFKNKIPYFQIGQHVRNHKVLLSISDFLSSLDSKFEFSNYSFKKISLVNSITINKRTNVEVIVYTNIDSLFDILAYHFLEYEFQSRKSIDFYYWCIVLYMYKFGYIYLEEGHKLGLLISTSINKFRYTTDKNRNLPEVTMELFNKNLPIQLEPQMSHVELAQKFSKINKNKDIYVYDNNEMVKGSPFVTSFFI